MGIAPTSVVTDPVFGTDAASLYLPAFHKMAARVGLAPTPCGLTNRRATLTLPGSMKLALPARLALASVRLEDECLSISATAALENGQRGRICTCDPSVPSRVRWLLRYALENGGSEGVRTLSLPADNGLLR